MNDTTQTATEVAVTQSSSFDLLRTRLGAHGASLAQQAATLNTARLDEFGRADTVLLARTRARTENNCVARDLVQVGDSLVFGYNVFIGLRKEIRVEDVFALYRMQQDGATVNLEAKKLEGSFLHDARFVLEFTELYNYYRNAQLVQLRVNQGKLLAAFKIGERTTDLRVFRWQIETNGAITYIDNRGERDMALPPTHDFEWLPTGRDQHVIGKHPHINILDTLFVETVGGDLTVKLENNTETGLGIYSEPVEDKNQSLTDAEVAYAAVGQLILLRIKPYRETAVRYFVFNRLTQAVSRVDAIGESCVQLPEDHGIVFPDGYILQSGEQKQFADLPRQLKFKRRVLAPNGEDVLYVFYGSEAGRYVLLVYNLIAKTLAQPLVAQGYARFDDGKILLFSEETQANSEPKRNHEMQLWQTPFLSEEHAAQQAPRQTSLGKIGNRELVRGVSELYSVAKLVREQNEPAGNKPPSRLLFETLIKQCQRTLDANYWLQNADVSAAGASLHEVIAVAKNTVDEFDKVAAVQREAQHLLQQAELENRQLLTDTASKIWQSPTDFADALAQLRLSAGRLSVLQDQRYIDVAKLAQLSAELSAEEARIAGLTIVFLSRDDAFNKLNATLAAQRAQLPNCHSTAALAPIYAALDKTAEGLDSLTNLLATLSVSDATLRTKILSTISAIFADVNKLRAQALQHRKALTQTESAAEFAAQFGLLGQSVESALEQSSTLDKCDEQLTRLLAQLEELEGRFTEQDEYLTEISFKREGIYAAFEARKQGLLAARTKRVQAIQEAAQRIVAGVPKRLASIDAPAQLEAYFASDALIKKLKTSIDDLRQLGSAVAADDLSGQLKAQREQALRALRDRNDLGGTNTIKLGQHHFTVNQQTLDLSIVMHKQRLSYHLTGTDYFLAFDDPRVAELKSYWKQDLVAESATVYRAEYLAYQIIDAAQSNRDGFSFAQLVADAADVTEQNAAAFDDAVRRFAAPRYQEGYQKGVHDSDAALILRSVLPMLANAGLLRYSPTARAVALLYWQHASTPLPHESAAPIPSQALQLQAEQAALMQQQLGNDSLLMQLSVSTKELIKKFIATQLEVERFLDVSTQTAELLAQESAAYLLAELGSGATAGRAHEWALSQAAATLAQAMQAHLAHPKRNVQGSPNLPWQNKLLTLNARWQLACAWLSSLVGEEKSPELRTQQLALLPEAAAALLVDFPRRTQSSALQITVQGMLGEHALLQPLANVQTLPIQLNDFLRRLQHHTQIVAPAFLQLQQVRQTLVKEEKARLRLEQFQAKPLSSFVRSRLINEVYLPMVGDNLAKQIGAAGDARRTDSMGMLLLISPPGYGKTTLMEYLCDRLGMIFVRINCPVLGHDVTSLDPAQAANSAAKMELEKLNLGLAMGSNVMLYLDDIQHTHPEFLQKFIGLADGTRRIEGVWRGENHTYDLRGKRFTIVMAGNPYTESGDVFKIPDMLANRADIYNLGDVLSGREDVFAMSYLENALVSHPVLQPLSARDSNDIYVLLRMAASGVASADRNTAGELKHPYTAEELSEICAVLQRLFKVRDALLQVNKTYIASAAQDHLNRTEPPFKLQGSYRNMGKLTPKISALMRDDELNDLLRDHYRGEAQTLTTGAEENLLKLAHLLGQPTPTEAARWQSLLDNVARLRKQGGADADGATKVANSLGDIGTQIAQLTKQAKHAQQNQPDVQINLPEQVALQNAMLRLAESYEQTLLPMLSAMNHKMRLDHSIWDGVREISANVSEMDKRLVQMSRERGVAGAEAGKKKEKPL